MSATLLWVALLAPPSVVIASVRGEQRVPVTVVAGQPVVAAPALMAALGGSLRRQDEWLETVVARQSLRFLVGAPFAVAAGRVEPLAHPVVAQRDTVYLPFEVVADLLPRLYKDRYRYDAGGDRLVDTGWQLVQGSASPARDDPGPSAASVRPPAGQGTLRRTHVVTLDPGHGGEDPGNPGLFFPKGLREKDVTLQVGLLVRDELRKRGVDVRMTRARDTLIALGDRGRYCSEACDLFVSLHVNSLPRRSGYTDVRGFETYFLAEAKTEDAERVARMENEAVRFEPATEAVAAERGLDFILKDLALNEYLRESARLAELLQDGLDGAHDGLNRGVKQAGFMVLTTARRPAVLVELGYSTNRDDARLLTAKASQRRLAAAIADAIVAYLAEYERRAGDAEERG
ncbi:MAG: N-acetylmuramoyl-L-alanine amidase [Gemmatimonadales bacterium]|nr:N-acetylmuramoyl-L-alanine amidase [Gemmatimonadales bacterium]